MRLAIAAIVALVVLAPTVPDEPLHLSGVMLTAGTILAVLGLVVGLVVFRTHEGAPRRAARWAALLSGLAIVGILVSFYVRAMSQLSSP